MSKHKFDKNSYDFNSKSSKGVYIIHGFSSTTYEVKELAEFLGKHGYHTIANNLPGHGTNVEECNKIKYINWINHVKQDFAKLASQSQKLYVIGNSMGAVLGLYLSSVFPINGFVTGGAVLRFKKYFSTYFLVPIICNFIKQQPKNKVLDSSCTQFYGYKYYPLKALNEYRKMIKIIIPKLKNIQSPGLIIHSENDKTSIKKNVDIIFDNINKKYLHSLFVKNAHHNMFDKNPDQNLIFKKILDFLNNN